LGLFFRQNRIPIRFIQTTIIIFMKTCIALLLFSAAAAFAAPQPGDSAPNFSLTDIQGQKHSLTDFKGKYVVLEWNNPDCPFVHKHYDSGNMQKLQTEERAKGVVWLTINSASASRQGDQPPAQLAEYVKENHADPTAYMKDPDGTVGHLYGAKTTPHMFVIDPDGKLVYEGGIDNKPTPDPADIPGATNYVKAALDESMSGKPVAVSTSRPYGCSIKY
jgi:peroxiredoxin